MKVNTTLLALAALVVAQTSYGSDVIIYPANGQDATQQNKDEGECFIWARDETGIDPMAQQAAAPTASQQKAGGALGGALRGAAIGGIVDGSDGAKTGAGVGAAMGLMRQNSRNRAAQQQQQQQAQQAQSINAQNHTTFNKAYGVCLSGKGYAVS